jgi:thiol-disulfide isomerase/thioredoxin
MHFLSIDPKNSNIKQPELDDKTPIEALNDSIKNGDKVFVLFYMVGCGPCEATIPEWKKIQNVLEDKYKKNDKYSTVLVVDIDKDLFSEVKNIDFQLAGFPTIKYIADNGKTAVDYENSDIKDKDRTIDSFINWIQTTVDKPPSDKLTKDDKKDQHGGFVYSRNKNKHASTPISQNTRSRKYFRGGKWSRKYKKSINCKKPKGFSQKQYCKYGRKTNKRKRR